MPHVGRDPNTRCDAGKREEKSNLEPPKKVVAIKRTKKKDTRRKQEPEAGISPAAAPCQLPDIEKADQSEEPNHEQLSSDVPMGQPSKSERNQPRKENSMFIVLREKVSERQSAVRHFFKKRGGSIPLIPNWDVNAIPEDEQED
jgi:hypothetical protein